MAPRHLRRPAAAEVVPEEAPEEEPAEPVEEPAGQVEALLEAKWLKLKKLAHYCGLCCTVIRSFSSHCSRRLLCKAHSGSRPLTEDELEALRAEFDLEQTDSKRAKELKVEAAKKKHAEQWKPPEVGAGSEAECEINFGKHKGKSIDAVVQADPEYFKHLSSWKNDIFQERPDLGKALERAGLLQGLQKQRPVFQLERALRTIQRVEEDKAKGDAVHPEIRKLRAMQQVEASAILQQLDGAKAEAMSAIVPLSEQPTKKRRAYRPSARILLPHCSACGSTEHKRQACPYRDLQGSGVPQQSQAHLAYLRNKREAKVVSRLKTTQIALRSEVCESKPSKSSRAPIVRSFLAYSRARAGVLANMLQEECT
jgi:hypothetical protein